MKLRLEWIAWVLVVAGIARAALLIAHEPLAGYANQYDMICSSACVVLYDAARHGDRLRAVDATFGDGRGDDWTSPAPSRVFTSPI